MPSDLALSAGFECRDRADDAQIYVSSSDLTSEASLVCPAAHLTLPLGGLAGNPNLTVENRAPDSRPNPHQAHPPPAP